jgi:hypothetical protein
MITSVFENQISKDKTYQLKDDKNGGTFARVVKKDCYGLSNVEIAFSDKTIDEFKKWMVEKKYSKTDCWCKHIQEFTKDANI